MKSLKNRSNDYFINKKGQNLFELTLKEAINKKGIESEITIQDVLTGELKKSIIISNKNAYNNQIGVEYHSRWCFYYLDKNGKNFIADYNKNENRINSQIGLTVYNDEINAIKEALISCGVM